jgi:hypothetical protein
MNTAEPISFMSSMDAKRLALSANAHRNSCPASQAAQFASRVNVWACTIVGVNGESVNFVGSGHSQSIGTFFFVPQRDDEYNNLSSSLKNTASTDCTCKVANAGTEPRRAASSPFIGFGRAGKS